MRPSINALRRPHADGPIGAAPSIGGEAAGSLSSLTSLVRCGVVLRFLPAQSFGLNFPLSSSCCVLRTQRPNAVRYYDGRRFGLQIDRGHIEALDRVSSESIIEGLHASVRVADRPRAGGIAGSS